METENGAGGSVRELADSFHERWLARNPFAASMYGIPGHDGQVPDDSEAGETARQDELESVLADARRIDEAQLSEADGITLGCLFENVGEEQRDLDARLIEHTVTAMPFAGPAVFFAVAARTVIGDPSAADAYLERLRASGGWIDQQGERLRIGAGKGRLPVGPLVQQAIEWAEGLLQSEVPEALATPRPPEGWGEEAAWREQRDRIAGEVVKPALARWVELLRELLPRARSAEEPGLAHLPGGEADYAKCVWSYTTLPLAPEEIHRIGIEEVAALEERALELGSRLGFKSLPEIYAASRASSALRAPADAMVAATAAIRRAEAQAGEFFSQPLPPPCAVQPMPPVVATSGTAPHYTPPRLDGGRPGTYWFNTLVPTAGTGWDLRGSPFTRRCPATTSSCPGPSCSDIPAMQRQRSITVFSEGWGLYTEQLAEEMGLYSGTESLLGSTRRRCCVPPGWWSTPGCMPGAGAARRPSSISSPMSRPPGFLGPRSTATSSGRARLWHTYGQAPDPGRDEARCRLGPAFAMPGFHAALLDSGSLPLPVLDRKIERWSSAA